MGTADVHTLVEFDQGRPLLLGLITFGGSVQGHGRHLLPCPHRTPGRHKILSRAAFRVRRAVRQGAAGLASPDSDIEVLPTEQNCCQLSLSIPTLKPKWLCVKNCYPNWNPVNGTRDYNLRSPNG